MLDHLAKSNNQLDQQLKPSTLAISLTTGQKKKKAYENFTYDIWGEDHIFQLLGEIK